MVLIARTIASLKEHRKAVKDVVFVIHGIRDNGYWTDKIARRILDVAGEKREKTVERVTSSYGFFGMAPFLFPWVRRTKVEWLLDQYIEARAKYQNPDVRFHYIGQGCQGGNLVRCFSCNFVRNPKHRRSDVRQLEFSTP